MLAEQTGGAAARLAPAGRRAATRSFLAVAAARRDLRRGERQPLRRRAPSSYEGQPAPRARMRAPARGSPCCGSRRRGRSSSGATFVDARRHPRDGRIPCCPIACSSAPRPARLGSVPEDVIREALDGDTQYRCEHAVAPARPSRFGLMALGACWAFGSTPLGGHRRSDFVVAATARARPGGGSRPSRSPSNSTRCLPRRVRTEGERSRDRSSSGPTATPTPPRSAARRFSQRLGVATRARRSQPRRSHVEIVFSEPSTGAVTSSHRSRSSLTDPLGLERIVPAPGLPTTSILVRPRIPRTDVGLLDPGCARLGRGPSQLPAADRFRDPRDARVRARRAAQRRALAEHRPPGPPDGQGARGCASLDDLVDHRRPGQ